MINQSKNQKKKHLNTKQVPWNCLTFSLFLKTMKEEKKITQGQLYFYGTIGNLIFFKPYLPLPSNIVNDIYWLLTLWLY
jgi:hypothetical protein